MNPLVCEMCNSNEVIKQNGVFVCQHCGTKYSVEEAKKMMIEGTVKIDNTDKLNNLYHLARRAKLENNEKNACKYYEMILLEDPTSWEIVPNAFSIIMFPFFVVVGWCSPPYVVKLDILDSPL